MGLLWFEAFHFRLHAGLLTAPNLHAYPGLLQRSAPSFLVAFTIGSAAIWMPCILQMVLVFSGVTAGARKFRGGWFFAGYIATYAVAGLMAASFGEAFGRLHVVGFAQVIGGIAVAVVGLSLLKVLRVPFLQACGSAMAFAMTKGRLHRLGRPTTGVAFALYCAGCCGPLLIPLYVFLATAGSLWLGAITAAGFALAMAVPIMALGLLGHKAVALAGNISKSYEVVSKAAGMALLTLGVLLALSGPLIRGIDALHS